MFTGLLDSIIDFAKKYALIVFGVFGALYLLGIAVENTIELTFLDSFFVFIRRLVLLFDFAFHTPTLFLLLGYSLKIFVAYWLYRATMAIIHLFITK